MHAVVPPEELYRVSGLQHLPFNTVFQLAARARHAPSSTAARRLLLIPDLLAYWLTGAVGAEVTNASTTGLLDATTREWSWELIDRLGLPRRAVPAAARSPGDRLGELRDDVLAETGLTGPVPVTAVGSHDTASAVVGVPASADRFAYISCGTWSLVGVELDAAGAHRGEPGGRASPTSSASTARSATCATSWACGCCRSRCAPGRPPGLPADLADLLAAAARVPAFTAVVDPDDDRVPAARRHAGPHRRGLRARPGRRRRRARPRPCAASSTAWRWPTGAPSAGPPSCPGGTSRSCTWSAAERATRCSASSPPTPAGCRCVAGPVEAAALGNALVQARAGGVLAGGLAELRALLRKTQDVRLYLPTPGAEHAWQAAGQRLALPLDGVPAPQPVQGQPAERDRQPEGRDAEQQHRAERLRARHADGDQPRGERQFDRAEPAGGRRGRPDGGAGQVDHGRARRG